MDARATALTCLLQVQAPKVFIAVVRPLKTSYVLHSDCSVRNEPAEAFPSKVLLMQWHTQLDWGRKCQFFEVFSGQGRVSQKMSLACRKGDRAIVAESYIEV